MAVVAFDTFEVQVPRGWADITDTVEAANAPYTLAHRNGVGALQFSVALALLPIDVLKRFDTF